MASILKISISRNPICDNLVGFPKSGHIFLWVSYKHCTDLWFAFISMKSNDLVHATTRWSRATQALDITKLPIVIIHSGFHPSHGKDRQAMWSYKWTNYYSGTVVWKIFVWNYFIVENVERIIFVVYQYPRKYFNNEIK